MKLNNEIGETEAFKIFCEEYDQNIDFLDSFSTLLFINGRIISFISEKNTHIVNTALLENSIKTLKSIKLCSSIGSFADGNTLIRKLRDDLILYVYILDVANKRKPFIEEDLKELNTDSAEEFSNSFSKLSLVVSSFA